MEANRIPCARCGSSILPVTAARHGGVCAPCAKQSAQKPATSFLRLLTEFTTLALIPFQLIRMHARYTGRRLRFPCDERQLLRSIAAVHTNPHAASNFLRGVIDGYFENHRLQFIWTQNPARTRGLRDGGQLRRGELKIDQIPSRHDSLPESSGSILARILGN